MGKIWLIYIRKSRKRQAEDRPAPRPNSNSCLLLHRDHHSCPHQFSPLPAQDTGGLSFAVCHHIHCHFSHPWGVLVLTPAQDKGNAFGSHPLPSPQESCCISYLFSFSVFSFSLWIKSFPLTYINQLNSLPFVRGKVEIRNGKRTQKKKLLECPLTPKIKTAWVSITFPTMDIKIKISCL